MRSKTLRISVILVFSLMATSLFLDGSQSNSDVPQLISGKAKIIDGDTLYVNDHKVRLFGIDAPEMSQTCSADDYHEWKCGEDSTAFLQGAVSGKEIHCNVLDIDLYDRYVAECYEGLTNINALMVIEGWAVNYDQYTDFYKADQLIAQTYKRGIWVSTFEMPWKFRQKGS